MRGRLKVWVSGHVSEVYGPVQALRHYLAGEGHDLAFVTHPFPYTSLDCSRLESFAGGRPLAPRRLMARRRNSAAQFLGNFFSSLLTFLGLGKADVYIGISNLDALSGILLRALGRVDKVVYYVIDHTPRRFPGVLLNGIYEGVDKICCRRADWLWCLSDRIAKAKQAVGAPAGRCLVVPVGVQLEEVRAARTRRPQVLVAMSHLTAEKGIQLILECFREIVKSSKRARLEIIGTGPYEAELKALARRLGLGKAVRFLGLMNHQQLFSYLPTCGIGLATYTEDLNNIAYFADPTKPKEYLACGLPVVITKVPWIWERIADPRRPMGVAISYDREALVQACLKLLKAPGFYARCRANARRFAAGLAWGKIFDQALERSLGELPS